jgi:hypothetical protein
VDGQADRQAPGHPGAPDSALAAAGLRDAADLEWARSIRWLERTVRDLAGVESHVIRVEIDPVSVEIPAR